MRHLLQTERVSPLQATAHSSSLALVLVFEQNIFHIFNRISLLRISYPQYYVYLIHPPSREEHLEHKNIQLLDCFLDYLCEHKQEHKACGLRMFL